MNESQDQSPWRYIPKLQDPKRFAEFVTGSPHVSQMDLSAYEEDLDSIISESELRSNFDGSVEDVKIAGRIAGKISGKNSGKSAGKNAGQSLLREDDDGETDSTSETGESENGEGVNGKGVVKRNGRSSDEGSSEADENRKFNEKRKETELITE